MKHNDSSGYLLLLLLVVVAHLFSDIVNEAAPSSVFHDEVEDVVGEVHVQQADDAGMLQPREHADLILNLVYLSNAAEVAGVH